MRSKRNIVSLAAVSILFCAAGCDRSVALSASLRPAADSGRSVELSQIGLSTDPSDAAGNLAKIEAAARNADRQGVPVHGYRATIPVSGEIVWPARVDFHADGMTITANGAMGQFPDKAVFYLAGSAIDLGALGDQTNARSMRFTLSSPPPSSVTRGSLIFLVNKAGGSFNAARLQYYYAGEAVVVQGVAGRTVSIQAPLRYSYPAKTTKVSLINPTTATIDGLNVQGVSNNSSVDPIKVRFGGPLTRLSSVYGYQSNHSGIEIWESYGVEVRDSRGNTSGSPLAGTNYGILLANVSNVKIIGGAYIGQRHGVAIGGSGGDYDITNFNSGATNASIGTTPQEKPVVAADMHGNCDACYYIGNDIRGGLEIGGVNNRIIDNRITTGTAYNLSQYCILVSELLGLENHISHNVCNIRSNSAKEIYAAGVDFKSYKGGLMADTTLGGTMDLTDNTFNFYVTSGNSSLVYVFAANINNTTAYPLNLDLSGSTFHFLGSDRGFTTHGAYIYSTHGGQHWTNVNLSNVSGDVSFDLRGVGHVKADNYRAKFR